MDRSKLIITMPRSQILDLVIEFPISILAEYNGISNLDETLDDNIIYFITQALINQGIMIKKASINIIEFSEKNDKKLSYEIMLIFYGKNLDLNCIVEILTKEKFQKGLRIIRKVGVSTRHTLYQDEYYGS